LGEQKRTGGGKRDPTQDHKDIIAIRPVATPLWARRLA